MITLTANKGSDVSFRIEWGQTGTLDGAVVAIYDAHPIIADKIDLAVTDSANRIISGTINWDEEFPLGRVLFFRVRVSFGQDDKTTQRFYLDIS
jgi:hypothetical protein